MYKRTPDLNLLRCLDAEEAKKIMNEVHARVCGPHMNGYVLAKKILRAGYYWLTMERDCFHFVKNCHQCQIHGDHIHSPHSELHPMAAPWPFVAWGMDVIGPIEPKASNGHRFILVAIDYFTKWVEAITFKAVTKKAVVDFVHSNIICRFGIPRAIITYNVANLNSNLMKEVCEQFKMCTTILLHTYEKPTELWRQPTRISKRFSEGWFKALDNGMRSCFCNFRISFDSVYLNWCNSLFTGVWN